MLMNRRGVLCGLASILAAPAIVHAGNLMPIKAMPPSIGRYNWWFDNYVLQFNGRQATKSEHKLVCDTFYGGHPVHIEFQKFA
jgi:hypothetical protein